MTAELEPGQSLSAESCSLLRVAELNGKQGNVLLIKHPALPWPEGRCLERNQQSFDRAIHLSQGLGKERFSGLACRSDELPFLDSSFRLVVLWHVLASGAEAELAEACRVLAAGGDLLVLGLQRRSFLARLGGQQGRDLPALQRQPLLRKLQDAGMDIVSVTGAGLPVCKDWNIRQAGLAGVLLPFTQLLLVQARHGNPATLTPLPLGDFRAEVARGV
ncbi:MAG TPA: hypothetical protein VFG52_05850 [Xanthomonadales bacterium]|nr:hypothetical protein [Xanthomonadales bacterium]